MRRILLVALIVGMLLGMGITSAYRTHEAVAQKAGDATQWDYKVGIFSYNPGENLTDERRASLYERSLKQHAAEGWEPIGSILSRDTIQTIGGGVTTRDTTSFVAYRRKR